MINESSFRQLLHKLLDKSKADKVRWVEGDAEEGGEIYTVIFPDAGNIDIYHNAPPSAPDFVRAGLFISGRLVCALSAEDGEQDWELLMSLYEDAQRCLYGLDKGLKIIEDSLGSQEISGAIPLRKKL